MLQLFEDAVLPKKGAGSQYLLPGTIVFCTPLATLTMLHQQDVQVIPAPCSTSQVLNQSQSSRLQAHV